MDLDPIIGGPPESSTETVDLPGSWRTSRVQPAPLFDPGGTFALRPDGARRCCVRISIRRTLPAIVLSRLDHAAVALPVYASQRRSPDHHATLGSGRWPPFPGSGRDAARFVREVSVVHLILLSQAWPGAHADQISATPRLDSGIAADPFVDNGRFAAFPLSAVLARAGSRSGRAGASPWSAASSSGRRSVTVRRRRARA